MNFTPNEEQWAKMKKHIKSDKYKPEDFFVFETRAVGDRVVPNRYTRLMPDFLSVMKEDAEKGVSLMLNHNWGQLGVQAIPIGKVFDARIEGSSQEGETTTLYTTQYIPKDDSKVDGYSKNDIINLIETGVLSDTSVGFSTGGFENHKCSICGNSIYDWKKCEHIPGQKYIVNKETNEVKMCVDEIHKPSELSEAGNNLLMENSLVFDGAYPNAVIQSVVNNNVTETELKALNGKQSLSKNDIIFGYTSKNGVNLLYKHLDEKGGIDNMAKIDENPENVEEVVDEERPNEEVATEETVEEVVVEETVEEEKVEEEPGEEKEPNEENAEEEPSEEPEETNNEEEVPTEPESMYTESDIMEKFGNIANDLEGLIQLAKEGLENRNEVIRKALDSGVHSMGNSFNKEVFTKTFSSMQTKDIEEMGKAWEEQANTKFSTKMVSVIDSDNFNKKEEKINLSNFKTSNY